LTYIWTILASKQQYIYQVFQVYFIDYEPFLQIFILNKINAFWPQNTILAGGKIEGKTCVCQQFNEL